MKAVLMGMRDSNFTDDRTGERIEGTKMFYAYDEDGTKGKVCADKFLKKGTGVHLPKDIQIGSIMILDFTEKGKLNDISIVSPVSAPAQMAR